MTIVTIIKIIALIGWVKNVVTSLPITAKNEMEINFENNSSF